ncbi:MAG: transcriptional repressor [Nitrospirae bacterium]|nr:transcriptional repressor [Nitrospirota bacterium]
MPKVFIVDRGILRGYSAKKAVENDCKRDLILEEFLGSRKHLSTEDLHNLIIQKDNTIGHTTVYRMLKLLTEAGLAREDDFGDGVKRYEYQSRHHYNWAVVFAVITVFFIFVEGLVLVFFGVEDNTVSILGFGTGSLRRGYIVIQLFLSSLGGYYALNIKISADNSK